MSRGERERGIRDSATKAATKACKSFEPSRHPGEYIYEARQAWRLKAGPMHQVRRVLSQFRAEQSPSLFQHRAETEQRRES